MRVQAPGNDPVSSDDASNPERWPEANSLGPSAQSSDASVSQEGGASTITDGPCNAGQASCRGNARLQCSSGSWVTESTCPYVCHTGSCAGSCSPGSRQCAADGKTAQRCDTTGSWITDTVCPNLCSNGGCTGMCTPSASECSGKQVRKCDASGAWVLGETCPFVCDGGTCTGSCVPNEMRCSALVPQLCNGSGQWISSPDCQYLCRDGRCEGQCLPGTKSCVGTSTTPQTCDANGAWQSERVKASVCGAECNPGANGCFPNSSRTAVCGTDGKWVAGSVSTSCGAACVPSATRCDLELHQESTCTADGNWGTGKVIKGRCGAECTPGNEACGTTADITTPYTYIVSLTNPIAAGRCDSKGQVVITKCDTACENYACPGLNYWGPIYACDSRSGKATCLTGQCPTNIPLDGC